MDAGTRRESTKRWSVDGSLRKSMRRSWAKNMLENELHKITATMAVYEEVVKRLLSLNNDLFWLAMQHISTEEFGEQLKERQEIDNLYKSVTD